MCPAANKNQPFQSLLTRLGFEKHLIFGANSQGVKFIVGELNFLRGLLVEGLLTKVSNQPSRAPDGGQSVYGRFAYFLFANVVIVSLTCYLPYYLS